MTALLEAFRGIIKEVSINTQIPYLDAKNRLKLFIEICLGYAKVRGGRTRDFPFSNQRSVNAALSLQLIDESLCLDGKKNLFSTKYINKYDFLVALMLLEISSTSPKADLEREVYYSSCLNAVINKLFPKDKNGTREMVKREMGLSNVGLDRSHKFYAKERIDLAITLAFLANEPIPNNFTKAQAKSHLLSKVPWIEPAELEKSVNLLFVKPKQVQSFLQQCQKSYIQRGASYWSSQILSRSRDILDTESRSDSLTVLLTDCDSVSILATSETIDSDSLKTKLRSSMTNKEDSRQLNREFIEEYYPRTLPYYDRAVQEGIETVNALPNLYTTVAKNVSLMDLIVDRSTLSDWEKKEDDVNGSLSFATTSKVKGDCTGRIYDQAFQNSWAVPTWYRPGTGDRYGWASTLFGLVGMSYKLSTNLSIQDLLSSKLSLLVDTKNTLKELVNAAPDTETQLTYVKFDGDKIGRRFTQLSSVCRPGLSLRLETTLRVALSDTLEELISTHCLDYSPLEIIYFGGDDILVALNSTYLEDFILCFNRHISNTSEQLNIKELSLSFAAISFDIGEQASDWINTEMLVLSALNDAVDKVKKGDNSCYLFGEETQQRSYATHQYGDLSHLKGSHTKLLNLNTLRSRLSPSVQNALTFADKAHRNINHRRKYDGGDYIVHPISVMKRLEQVEHNESMLIAALLHDTVEDTEVTMSDIEHTFGSKIAKYIYWLTDISQPTDGNRKFRKELDRLHIAKAPSEVKSVKLADLLDNSDSILKNDKHFSKLFIDEFSALLTVLEEGNSQLFQQAELIIKNYKTINPN